MYRIRIAIVTIYIYHSLHSYDKTNNEAILFISYHIISYAHDMELYYSYYVNTTVYTSVAQFQPSCILGSLGAWAADFETLVG